MGRKRKLPVTEELDFHYLLELMVPLHNTPDFAWLPELFSIIGHENLLKLCKYAGGEKIRIPTLDQLNDSIEALQYFYDIQIKHEKEVTDVPLRLVPMFTKVCEVYNAREREESNSTREAG